MEFINVGIDLGIVGNHWAAVLDSKGETLAAPFAVSRDKRGLDRLWQRIQEVTPEGVGVRVILEPTGWIWLPVAVYLAKKGAIIVRPSTSETAALRRFYRRHAKSDRIDTRVLARLPLIKPGSLPVMELPHPRLQALWRLCKQRQRMVLQAAGIKKRVRGMVEAAIPGLSSVFANPVGPAARCIYRDYLNPWRAREAGLDILNRLLAGCIAPREKRIAPALAQAVLRLVEEASQFYGDPEGRQALGLDHDMLQEELRLELELLEALDAHIARVEHSIDRLYRELHPEDYLESIPGVGSHGAPVSLSAIGDPQRFPGPRQFRSYGGMVPRSRESGATEAKGTPLTKAGPPLLRSQAFLGADVASRYDPHIAACYYDQVVNKGKHHYQALCACAGKLVARVLKVLQDRRPYQLRDVEGNPVTWHEAQRLIRERYQVPAEVRRSRRSRRPPAWKRPSMPSAASQP